MEGNISKEGEISSKEIPKETYLPNSVYEGLVWGNSHYPQMIFAQPVMAGFEAIKHIQKGEFTWAGLADSKLSPTQMDKLRDITAKIHSAYQVPHSPEKHPMAKEEGTRFTFGDSVLSSIWTFTKDPIFRSSI